MSYLGETERRTERVEVRGRFVGFIECILVVTVHEWGHK